ncbi:hypothetical protein NW759_002088 [Fusarium solani]|uniref:Uncharacterized protein n=1 Tax=Fusarium solani TaxID=169388 RepID=A0A9P9HW79_FUSSL|nr:uncharacterized protein B0J15DRAFT_268740 [Fusarium solani]KAH7264323.1 hypothetical protein B0J15DRAFT_268740 [Fusarium solani]KAJ4233307.1 hypothetical protein NW759_002088 [Fusarium solani]
MPSRSSSSSNPSEDIKFSWKDQLSPRLMGLRGFRRASESTAKMRESENRQFTMMHFPDRPTRRITEAEIPSEEECKQYLIRMRKASFAEQLQRRKEEEQQQQQSPPPPEPPLRSTFGPFKAPFLPLTPAQEEENSFETGSPDDNTTTGDFLRVPDDDSRISNITEDGFNLARENSPQPVIISEAKTVRLERVDNLSPGGSPDASPTSSPRVTEAPREWSKRKQSVQMVAIQRTPDFQKRKQSVQTVLIRRPSRAVHDALNSHPVHPHLPPINVHIRQDSSSDLLCRVCHVGLAENSGTCSTCGEEYSAPTSPSQSHHDLPGANFSRPQYKQPQPIKKYHRPPPLIPQSLDTIASLHRPSASLTSNPEANQLSPPPSPRSPSSATHPTQKVLTMADAPPTPLSALPTPEVMKRFQQEIESKARAEGGSMFGDPWNVRPIAEESKSFEDAWDRKTSGTESDVYEDDWADYYFDEGNFGAGRRKQTKVTTPEVQGFMQRELSLDEYDGAFASPVNPGPGWI